jgi:hypothetical protein
LWAKTLLAGLKGNFLRALMKELTLPILVQFLAETKFNIFNERFFYLQRKENCRLKDQKREKLKHLQKSFFSFFFLLSQKSF